MRGKTTIWKVLTLIPFTILSSYNFQVNGMFSHDLDYEDFTETKEKAEFYANDGVCLFKYFVLNDDPQRGYVWAVLVSSSISHRPQECTF